MRNTQLNRRGSGTSVSALASVAGLLIATLACGGESKSAGAAAAQGEQRAAARRSGYSPLTYPLDEAKVRKVAAVMRAWDPTRPLPKTDDENELAAAAFASLRDGDRFMNKIGTELIDQNSTATIDSTPELKTAIQHQGLSPREFVEALLAYNNAMAALDVEGLEKVYGDKSGRPSNLQKMMTGVFKDNVELIRRMSQEEELPSW